MPASFVADKALLRLELIKSTREIRLMATIEEENERRPERNQTLKRTLYDCRR